MMSLPEQIRTVAEHLPEPQRTRVWEQAPQFERDAAIYGTCYIDSGTGERIDPVSVGHPAISSVTR